MAAQGILKFFRPVRDAAPYAVQQQRTTSTEQEAPSVLTTTATTASRKRRRASTQPQTNRSTHSRSYFKGAHGENQGDDASAGVNDKILSDSASQQSRAVQEITGQQGSAKPDARDAPCGSSAVACDEVKDQTSVAVEGVAHEPEISEYEKKRLATMAANAAFLQQLGMAKVQRDVLRVVQSTARSAKSNKPKAAVRPMKELLPSRRSQRLRDTPVDASAGALNASQQVDEAGDNEDEPPADSFDDSSVLRYSCASKTKVAVSVARGPTDVDSKRNDRETSLIGFSFDASAPALADPQLKKIYSLSFSPFQENGLIAAGGHQGYVSIYPRDPTQVEDTDVIQSPKAAAANSTLQPPLMAFKAHSGWISSVSLSKSVEGEKNILLTTSNDSFLKVWDLNQSSSLSKTAKEVFKTNRLHRNGIFGMDSRGDSLLTCSKDASIAFSQFRDNGSGLDVVQRFEEHDGVVKSVRFSALQPDQFASGGNDRVLRVFDVRSPNAAALQIDNAHTRAINSVQWHPRNSNWILSASFDPDLHLFDMRNPASPLFTFRGHYHGNQQNAIYHPALVDNGRATVAAGGPRCQEISLYKTHDGSTISRGHIGMKADYIVADPFQDRILMASGGRLEFASFRH